MALVTPSRRATVRIVSLIFSLSTLLAVAQPAGQEERVGEVQFSDGTVRQGDLYLSRGHKLKMQHRDGMSEYRLDQIQTVSFLPEKEEMVQKWKFIEAGKAGKEKRGEPYPVCHLRCVITLTGGYQRAGLLYSCVIYIREGDKVDKIRLMSKLRGQPGQKLPELSYPKLIAFAAAEERETATFQLPPDVGHPSAITAISDPDLIRSTLKSDDSGAVWLPAGMPQLAIGFRVERKITVYWPTVDRPDLAERISSCLSEVKEFFDNRQLLAVSGPRENGDVFSLMLLSRAGKTTLAKEKSQPWRLEVWRWKYDQTEEQLLLAGKGYFFRDIDEKGQELPRIEIRNQLLWNNKTEPNDSP